MPVVAGASSASGGSQQGEAPTRLKLLQMVTDAAGVLETSERTLGSRLGVSSTRARRLLSELAAAGAIKVRTSTAGTTITFMKDVSPT
jgi:CTP-dependent riboflavin kinase